jgi:signal transduction histidine kinase
MAAPTNDADLLRRRILNVVGHELRTPVSTLAGLAQQLERCDDEAERHELTEAIARNARRLDRLVDDLLLAAGVTTVVPVAEPVAVDLVAVARSAWTGPPGAVTGRAVALVREESARRAVGELLDNAIGYGTEPFAVTGSEADGRAVIEVANGGPPVSEDEIALAAELFFRGERAVTARAGLGLGLSLARTVVEADGGSLTIGPRPGGGVVARIELPSAHA